MYEPAVVIVRRAIASGRLDLTATSQEVRAKALFTIDELLILANMTLTETIMLDDEQVSEVRAALWAIATEMVLNRG